jgi:hypothetical protein
VLKASRSRGEEGRCDRAQLLGWSGRTGTRKTLPWPGTVAARYGQSSKRWAAPPVPGSEGLWSLRGTSAGRGVLSATSRNPASKVVRHQDRPSVRPLGINQFQLPPEQGSFVAQPPAHSCSNGPVFRAIFAGPTPHDGGRVKCAQTCARRETEVAFSSSSRLRALEAGRGECERGCRLMAPPQAHVFVSAAGPPSAPRLGGLGCSVPWGGRATASFGVLSLLSAVPSASTCRQATGIAAQALKDFHCQERAVGGGSWPETSKADVPADSHHQLSPIRRRICPFGDCSAAKDVQGRMNHVCP